MSRSRKKAPVCYNACGQSQKRGKQFSNRKFRSMEREAMVKCQPDYAPQKQREVMPTWDLGCEGISTTSVPVPSFKNE